MVRIELLLVFLVSMTLVSCSVLTDIDLDAKKVKIPPDEEDSDISEIEIENKPVPMHKTEKTEKTALEPPRTENSGNELHALMEALGRYLHKTESKSTESEAAETAGEKEALPPNAHEDIRTVYAAGVNEQDVTKALADGIGFWTNYIDIDQDPSKSTGEYEDCTNIKWRQNEEGRCFLGCESPVAARYQVVDSSTKATWSDIENCIGPIDAARANSNGFTCDNADAKAYPKTTCELAKCVAFGLGEGCVRCPDVQVQFFCKGRTTDDGVAPAENRCCPYSMSCKNFKDLKSSLLQLDRKHRNDVVAGILAEVSDVLENEQK